MEASRWLGKGRCTLRGKEQESRPSLFPEHRAHCQPLLPPLLASASTAPSAASRAPGLPALCSVYLYVSVVTGPVLSHSLVLGRLMRILLSFQNVMVDLLLSYFESFSTD